jgi:hypothetical protein
MEGVRIRKGIGILPSVFFSGSWNRLLFESFFSSLCFFSSFLPLSFIGKETGRKCYRDVIGVSMVERDALPPALNRDMLFGDDHHILVFELKQEEKKG